MAKVMKLLVLSSLLTVGCANMGKKDCKGGQCEMKKSAKSCSGKKCEMKKKEAKKSCCSKKKS